MGVPLRGRPGAVRARPDQPSSSASDGARRSCLLQVFGITIAVRQVAFNWVIFYSPTGRDAAAGDLERDSDGDLPVVTAPLMIAFGLDGYAAGMTIGVLVDLVVRGYFLSRLFEGFDLGSHMLRSVLPSVPPGAGDPGDHAASSAERTLGLAIGELVLYIVLTVVSTLAFERRLLGEMLGYVRRGMRAAPAPADLHVAEQPHAVLEPLAFSSEISGWAASGRRRRPAVGWRPWSITWRSARERRLIGRRRIGRLELERVGLQVVELLALAPELELQPPVGGHGQALADPLGCRIAVDVPLVEGLVPARVVGGGRGLELCSGEPGARQAVRPGMVVEPDRLRDQPRQSREAGRRPGRRRGRRDRRSPAEPRSGAGRARRHGP